LYVNYAASPIICINQRQTEDVSGEEENYLTRYNNLNVTQKLETNDNSPQKKQKSG